MNTFVKLVQISIIAIVVTIVANPSTVKADADDSAHADVQLAEQDEWGWQVMVNAGNYFCGGTLVAADWVLTAAHCLYDGNGALLAPEDIQVVAGETNRYKLENTEQRLSVNAIFVNDSQDGQENDIALLRLTLPANLNKYVTTVAMISPDKLHLTSAGQMAMVTGWGAAAEGGRTLPELRVAPMQIVTNDICQSLYGSITDNMICGSYIAASGQACQADEGGPLVVADEHGNWYLAGVLSLKRSCGLAGYHSAFARVSEHRAWVDATMAANSSAPGVVIPNDRAVEVVGGQPAEQGEWGWQVMINAGGYICGGSLIDTGWVLTAAHCLYDGAGNIFEPSDIRIVAGETNRYKIENTEQILGVDAVFVHQDYSTRKKNHDIALLRLNKLAILNKFVTTVPLATQDRLSLTAPGQTATVTGWGMTSEGGRVSHELMEAAIPVVDNDTCQRSYGGLITDNMLCAGYAEGGVDACQGDSGGPLVVLDEQGKWHLVGVVSFGFGCARAKYYGVYARVSQYVPWVEDTMAANVKIYETIVDSVDDAAGNTDDESGTVDNTTDNVNDTTDNVDNGTGQPNVDSTDSMAEIVFLPLVMR